VKEFEGWGRTISLWTASPAGRAGRGRRYQRATPV